MTALGEGLAVFVRSDLSQGCEPGWYVWGAITGTHILLGIVLSLLPRWSGLAVLALWLVKELAFDMPGADWAALVVLDSAADLGAALAGWLFGRWLAMRPLMAGRAGTNLCQGGA
jgi:hypothetical protein